MGDWKVSPVADHPSGQSLANLGNLTVTQDVSVFERSYRGHVCGGGVPRIPCGAILDTAILVHGRVHDAFGRLWSQRVSEERFQERPEIDSSLGYIRATAMCVSNSEYQLFLRRTHP